MASVYYLVRDRPGGLSYGGSVRAELHLAALMEGHVRQMRSGNRAGSDFDGSVRLFAGTHAIQKVLNVGFDGNGCIHLLNGLWVFRHRLFPDPEALIIDVHGPLVALEQDGQVVFV